MTTTTSSRSLPGSGHTTLRGWCYLTITYVYNVYKLYNNQFDNIVRRVRFVINMKVHIL